MVKIGMINKRPKSSIDLPKLFLVLRRFIMYSFMVSFPFYILITKKPAQLHSISYYELTGMSHLTKTYHIFSFLSTLSHYFFIKFQKKF